MKREHLAFLLGGFAFGILVGYGLTYGIGHRPDLSGSGGGAAGIEAPRGPAAPGGGVGPSGSDGAAPMMREINALKRALTENPDDVGALIRLAAIYQQVAMWESAAELFERAVAAGADRPEVLLNLGLCYRGMGRFEDALDTFARAHAQEPSHWQSLFNSVVVAAGDLGQFDRAFATLESLEAMGGREPLPEGFRPAQVRELRSWLEGLGDGGPAAGS